MQISLSPYFFVCDRFSEDGRSRDEQTVNTVLYPYRARDDGTATQVWWACSLGAQCRSQLCRHSKKEQTG